VSPDNEHFKEYSAAREVSTNIPVYFERWQRYENDSKGEKYMAVRRRSKECPQQAHAAGRFPDRDAVFIIVGDHFALADNRCTAPYPSFDIAPMGGRSKNVISGPGGPALVDQALAEGLSRAQRVQGRAYVEQYLDLEGSYGIVSDEWKIIQSTHPWKEGNPLLDIDNHSSPTSSSSLGPNDDFFALDQPLDPASSCISLRDIPSLQTPHLTPRGKVHIKWTTPTALSPSAVLSVGADQPFSVIDFQWQGYSWEMVECSFSVKELQVMFGDQSCEYSPPKSPFSRL
jgi:hypothetical protein